MLISLQTTACELHPGLLQASTSPTGVREGWMEPSVSSGPHSGSWDSGIPWISPGISAYPAVRYVPDSRLRITVSRLISDYQPPDQHLSTTMKISPVT